MILLILSPKKRRSLQTIEQLSKDTDQLAKETEEKQDFYLPTKSNSFRLTAMKKQNDTETLDGTLKLLAEKKSPFNEIILFIMFIDLPTICSLPSAVFLPQQQTELFL